MPGRTSIRPEKAQRVELLTRQILDAPLTAIIGIRGVPASAMQDMRREMRARGHPMVVAPNSALRHALERAAAERPALKPLLDHVVDQTALLVAEANPFALAQELDRTRSPTPARGGELAPNDIFVPAGTTSFKPGPIVGELQHAGFPAAIEKGKVVLKKDVTIVKAGQPISREVATMLTRLDIKPLEVGLNLRALVDRETFYPPAVLAIDLDAQRDELVHAHRLALGLAMEIAWFSPATIEALVIKGHRGALAVAIESGYPTPATIPALFAKAIRQAKAVEGLGAN
ncbi:MAG TPA: 50S ribosomal protein L10 [Thermoplasmata archaeon]|nr:50S ribosomal protein L10 [Thermoplasmata archaeon]